MYEAYSEATWNCKHLLNNLFRNYGLSDLPIGKEMKQNADAVEDTEDLIEDCIFITRMKRRIK